MKRFEAYIYALLTAVAMVLTGCSADDGNLPSQETRSGVVFGACVKAPATRAGQVGDMDFKALATSGFGVYAYGFTADDFSASVPAHATLSGQISYTGTTPAAELTNPTDVFFYPGNWTYPGSVIDWPDAIQKISFFAYAPYVASPGGNEGITAISSGSGDPKVTYTLALSPDKGVDLLWGINETDGLPWVNKTLADTPDGSGAVLFTFHHALSAIGFHVQAMIDKKNETGNLTDVSEVANLLGTSENYKITVKKLTITGAFYQSAKLNLNSTSAYMPKWEDKTDEASRTLTVGNSWVNAAFRHPDDVTPTTTATAESIMTGSLTGVTQTAQQLLIAKDGDVERCFYVIPNSTANDYTIAIDWCISGKAPNGSYIFEDRHSEVPLTAWTWEPGTKYYFNFVMGLKTFKLSVDAVDWTSETKTVNIATENGTSASESLAKGRR